MACIKTFAGLMLLCLAGGALAANAPGSAAVQHNDKQQPTSSASPDGFGSPVSASALQHYSGGAGLVQNNLNINGTISNNTATHVTTGDNVLSGNAFEDASGLPSVIQNTGNNVLIQTGVIVNVQLKP